MSDFREGGSKMTPNYRTLGGKGGSPRHIGFNNEGVYDADYRTVYTLVTNR